MNTHMHTYRVKPASTTGVIPADDARLDRCGVVERLPTIAFLGGSPEASEAANLGWFPMTGPFT